MRISKTNNVKQKRISSFYQDPFKLHWPLAKNCTQNFKQRTNTKKKNTFEDLMWEQMNGCPSSKSRQQEKVADAMHCLCKLCNYTVPVYASTVQRMCRLKTLNTRDISDIDFLTVTGEAVQVNVLCVVWVFFSVVAFRRSDLRTLVMSMSRLESFH